MTIRNLIFGGAGAMALGLTLIAGTASAQISYPSTPRERAATADLNRHGVTVIGPSAEDQDAYEDAQSDYESRLDSYNAQQRARQDEFNARQNSYRQSRDSYDAERNAYEARQDQYQEDVRDYADATTEIFDNDAIDPADVARLERIDSFADDGADIADAPVEDRYGTVVGHFRHIQTDRNGYSVAIVTLHNQRTVEVPTDNLRFDPERDTVLADLTYNELERMRRG